ncbi:sentrin-specific protease-like isoform X1 [Leptopilina heterotoma]|uniref:sentrin-specific protease-like isoform X1 n=1 Tax=Leptopilina heterotoma TaxID=63436 RepID=UPI001CA8A9E7|nr:sentrin-specific protease-like isoform X1 [Leptopilina heterotoma]
MMNMVNNVFDFIRNIFTWADRNQRKRAANDSLPFEQEIISNKRFRYGDPLFGNELFLNVQHDENNENAENDDMEIIAEFHSSPLRSFSQMNNNRRNKRRSLPASKANSYRNNPPAQSSYHYCNNNSEMGCSRGRGQTNNAVADSHNSTLVRTHRLQEKQQYGELLQNFVPQRRNVMRSEPEKNHVSSIEVIELDKSDESQTSQKSIPVQKRQINTSWRYGRGKQNFLPQRWNFSESESTVKNHVSPIDVIELDKNEEPHFSQKSIPAQKRQIYTPWRCDRGRNYSGGRSRNSLPSNISRIQIEKEEPVVQSAFAVGKDKTQGNAMPLKVLQTNTLREALASKSVLKKDLVPQIAKRHDERIKQQLREAEELKRRANLLSDANRMTRELSLDEQLARTLKLCKEVYDDREIPDEEPLPTLTDGMLHEVKNALAPRSSNDVLAEGFGLRITRKDIQTLAGLNWLNDEVINFYMNLLIERGNNEKFPTVHAMNTFFYPKLLSTGHSSLKRWTRKIDIFAKDIVVVPIHLGIHWCMSIIDFRDKTIKYFDSMGSANPKCLVALRKYLEDESIDKKKKSYDTSDWKLDSVKDIPQQMNGSDCGVFSCMFAEFICAKRNITFTQQDMPYFRNKMAYEILKGKLL